MKCINRLLMVLTVTAVMLMLGGCGDEKPSLPYDEACVNSAFSVSAVTEGRTEGFASSLCVVEKNNESVSEPEGLKDTYASAAVFDVSNARTLYSVDVFEKLYPASLTKVMTAIVAMEHAQKEDKILCSENVKITEAGAQVCGLKAGDSLTMQDAMDGLLLYSGNDAAVAIAESVAGSVEAFADMMNERALSLGATSTHFVNPNGLHSEEHYTTAYDMYLMFNEAVKHDWFRECISKQNCILNVTDTQGNTRELTFNSTNLYLKGDAVMPQNVTVIGGKTGTTNAALNNLVLLSEDAGGKPYISIVMKSNQRVLLYEKMSSILDIIH